MIVINVRFTVKPEYADDWPRLSRDFTEATRAEPGNLWFDWSRSIDDPNRYVLIEAFEDDAAESHVTSEHFHKMQADFPRYLANTPQIINARIDSDGWAPMGELQV